LKKLGDLQNESRQPADNLPNSLDRHAVWIYP
jgi:hypothetical protein